MTISRHGRLAGLLLFLTLLFAVLPPAFAQEGQPDPAQDPIAVLDLQTEHLETIRQSSGGEITADEMARLRDEAMVVGMQANLAVNALVPQLTALDGRIAELGEPAADEAPDIKTQRERLATERSDLDSAIKRGRLLAADAKDTIDQLILDINEAFNRDTFKRIASPLSPALWRNAAEALPDDTARLYDFLRVSVLAIPSRDPWTRAAVLALCVAGALLLILPARRRLRAAGRRFAINQVPATRARRSGLALWFVLVGTITAGLAFTLFYLGLNWAGILSRWTRPPVEAMTATAVAGSFVVSLGAGLLLVGQPSWRLLPISEATARRLRSYPSLSAVLTFLGVFLVEGARAVGVSESAAILVNYVVAFTYCALIVSVLVSLGRQRRLEADAQGREPSAHTTIVTLATIAAWIAVVVAVGAALQGYVNFALFLSRQTIWTAIAAAATYLLVVVADDLCTTLFSNDSPVGRSLHSGLGIRKSQVSQIGVVLSALLRIAILVGAAMLLSGPLGPGASSLFYQFGNTAEITIGGFTIVPASILKAAVVLVIGITLMRTVRHWLDERYLPATDLDPGARNSVSTIVSYAGIILAGFWALTALGIGVERIALVVSALSVGIGFGLQAITQNFVSGLILLAERPVKIGDTVRIGTDEGDVKRISVRSTEIQIADRSTLIVPNSELITKPIRNMTLANPLGRIQVAFSVPLASDVGAIRRVLLAVYAENETVLPDPSPSVFIDSIDGGAVSFKSFAFVPTPRHVYATRSTLFFTLLERLRQEGVEIVAPPA